jgi:hypothetical protein
MAEHEQLVRLRKAVGGNTMTHDGVMYSWPAGDPVADVPYGLAVSLLAVPEWGYSVEAGGEALHVPGSEGAPGSVRDASTAGLAASREGAPQGVTEPAPDDEEHKVTEPAPKAAHPVAEGGENTGSPVTPRPRAGTRQAARPKPSAKK